MADNRVTGFLNAQGKRLKTIFQNGFKVREMPAFNSDIPMSQQDGYHMLAQIGLQASNTTHHHKYGDVTVFFSETAPTNFHGKSNRGRRYIVIADQWTGKQLQVFLPDYYEHVPEKPEVGDIIYDDEAREAVVTEVFDHTLICDVDGIKLPYNIEQDLVFKRDKMIWLARNLEDWL